MTTGQQLTKELQRRKSAKKNAASESNKSIADAVEAISTKSTMNLEDENIASQDTNNLFGFQTLPRMESAVGESEAQQLLDDIVQDEEDYGCICEIDLSQRNKIRKIISELLYPPQTNKNNKPTPENNNKKSKKKVN